MRGRREGAGGRSADAKVRQGTRSAKRRAARLAFCGFDYTVFCFSWRVNRRWGEFGVLAS